MWYTMWQTAAHQTTRGGAVDRYVCEFWSPSRGWEWVDQEAGEFRLTKSATVYRIRPSPTAGLWVIEWESHG